jgi:2-(1,2-epoxy-1,2-dihydrophenyl)acetyl-CoA isomerase
MSYKNYETLVVTVDDYVATVRMNRPEKLNAFNQVMGRELIKITDDLKNDNDVRCIVLTGTGRGFCSGVDLGQDRSQGDDNLFNRGMLDEHGFSGRVALAWNQIDKPTIASINGVAAGGGLGLAMLQDIRITCKSARLIPIFTRRGIPPELGMSWTAPNLIGYSKALEWFYTGNELSGQAAFDIGIANHVVDDDKLVETTMNLAKRISEWSSPIANRLTKRTVYASLNADSLENHLIYEAMNVGLGSATEDTIEGRQSVIEKRKPNYKGK